MHIIRLQRVLFNVFKFDSFNVAIMSMLSKLSYYERFLTDLYRVNFKWCILNRFNKKCGKNSIKLDFCRLVYGKTVIFKSINSTILSFEHYMNCWQKTKIWFKHRNSELLHIFDVVLSVPFSASPLFKSKRCVRTFFYHYCVCLHLTMFIINSEFTRNTKKKYGESPEGVNNTLKHNKYDQCTYGLVH